MSDAPEPSFVQRTLDLLVFAPAGLALTALEDLPAMAVKGRERVETHIRNAHLVGRLVVTRRRPAPDPSPPPPAPAPAPAPDTAETPPAEVRSVVADLAIPDYDTLSASQVVRRLDGLGPLELEAVYRHEAANRGRRTILGRASQLLGG